MQGFSRNVFFILNKRGLLNIRNKIQQQSSIHRVFCLMVGGVFVNISLHHSLACWRKIGRIDTNKGTIATLGIYWITSKNSHFTHQVLSDNLLGRLPIFAPNIKTNCQIVYFKFQAAFHFFEKSILFAWAVVIFLVERKVVNFLIAF